ncbi:MAG TPA: UDP-glucose 4-epimerase GalE [Steroidobacteraceae bacterium]|nr:UDP-glucose 4-epimerase GalE [Steroidobacteraceae bacterium]
MTVLVTGGAGYVGSHALQLLRDSGIRCVVLDNLSRGHRELAGDAPLVVGDIADPDVVTRVLREHDVDAVMHFAAYAYVGESVQQPDIYYRNNVAGTLNLLECLVRHGVRRFVFSSTCATYGLPQTTPIEETHPQRPVNPYGASKLMVERILSDFDHAFGLRSVVFRYFNAAGADPQGRIGEWHEPETHLIPIALQAARGVRGAVEVFGDDYPTPDGTCIRDYIHVTDLAQAHLLGLRHLQAGGASEAFNLGNNNGFSVREVITAAEQVTGRKIPWKAAPRRAGDPHALVGSAVKAQQRLGWKPQFPGLDTIIETAWKWHLAAGH